MEKNCRIIGSNESQSIRSEEISQQQSSSQRHVSFRFFDFWWCISSSRRARMCVSSRGSSDLDERLTELPQISRHSVQGAWSCAFLLVRKSDRFAYTQLFFLSAILPPHLTISESNCPTSHVGFSHVDAVGLLVESISFANRRNLAPSRWRALISRPSRNWAWCLS